MPDQRHTLVGLLEDAAALARSRAASERVPWRRETYDTVASNFAQTAAQVRSGQWRSAPGAGLGATKFLSETGLDDHLLYTAIAAAEDHHRRFGAT